MSTTTTGTARAIPSPPCAQLLGWRLLDHDPQRGWVRIGFDGKPEFRNPAGYIQGGLLSAMLDDCMGPAVWFMTNGERYTATIDMNVSYLAPAKVGPLFGEGQVIKLGSTIAFLEARLTDADGQLIARATSTARLLSARDAVRM
jgi:uncharacterized protein (TIGR00369 family)